MNILTGKWPHDMTLCVHKMHHDSMPLLIIDLLMKLAEPPFLSLFLCVSHIALHYSNTNFIFCQKSGGGGGDFSPFSPLSTPLG